MITKTEILKYLENKNIKIFFSGIGGISMSAIAAALIQKNYTVGGSDIKEKSETQQLEKMGAQVFIPQKAENLDGYDLFVYTARITEDNPEMIRARELGIPVIKRAQMLAALMEGYKKTIGVTGTHGKSTVSAMISEIFIQAKTDPTFFIGAVYPPAGSAYRIGKEDFFILESDEAYDSFLNFFPDIAVLTNIEMDHPDYFKDLRAMINSYKKYFSGTKECAVINADDPNSLSAAADFGKKIFIYAIYSSAGIKAENIVYTPHGTAGFDIYAFGSLYACVKLNVLGEYNVYNALAAAAAAYACGIPGEAVTRGLGIFKGAARRFEFKGEFNNVKIYEDYAHHPTELRKTLEAAGRITAGKIWCVIQPHTYSRTSALETELCAVIAERQASGNINIILTDIFSATEPNTYNIYSEDIALKTGCGFISNFGEIAGYLKTRCSSGDIVLLMGAGDVNEITELLLFEQ